MKKLSRNPKPMKGIAFAIPTVNKKKHLNIIDFYVVNLEFRINQFAFALRCLYIVIIYSTDVIRGNRCSKCTPIC